MDNKSQALRHLNIAKSTFYYKPIMEAKDEAIRVKIEQVLDDNPSYGHKRIATELKLNRKRISRVMKKFGIKPRRRRKKPWNRAKDGEFEALPNLLVSLLPLYRNHVWITDFTYLKWRNRWVYVCTIIDLFSREVLGISIKTNRGAILTSEALLNALTSNPAPAIAHSDQGSEYKAKLFQAILKDYKILQSMSKKGSPWQNGYQESFFGNWKIDIGDVNRFATLGELTAELYRSMYYYNNLRIHTSLGMPPRKFARQYETDYNTMQERLVV
jgi:transposase InsO family protein